MWTRVSDRLVVVAALGLLMGLGTSCSSSSGGGNRCTPGQQSTPGMPGDPCPQVGTGCANGTPPGMAVATCQEDGTWPPVNPGCMCVASTTCGNGTVEPGEMCDGAALNGMSCASLLGAGAGGVLVCAMDCASFDMSMCTAGGAGSGTAGTGS